MSDGKWLSIQGVDEPGYRAIDRAVEAIPKAWDSWQTTERGSRWTGLMDTEV